MEKDFLPINGTDFIELYVGNAKQAAYYYQSDYGFELVVYAGPETGVKDKVSYVLKQNKSQLKLTTAIYTNSDVAEHVKKHGDSVKVLALWVYGTERSIN